VRPCLQMEQVCQSAPRYAALRVADRPRDHAAADRADNVGKPRGQESVHGAGFSPDEPSAVRYRALWVLCGKKARLCVAAKLITDAKSTVER